MYRNQKYKIMIINKSFPILLLGLLLIYGCEKENLVDNSKETEIETLSTNTPLLYNQFAAILSKAVSESSNLRAFIKHQALKEFNNDHDVLYNYVKNEKIDSKLTFKELLSQYQEYPNQLDIIENTIPTLTIFVPSLVEAKFNPDNWDTNKDIPMIATNIMKKNGEIPVYEDGDEVFTLNKNEIPGFPILVVKPNERVRVTKDIKLKGSNIGKESFEFLSPAFNGLLKTKGTVGAWDYTTDPSIMTAYQEFGVDVTKWQRDYVYYRLTNQQTTGPLQRNMRETIAMVKLTRDALNKISDQTGDPVLTPYPNQTVELPSPSPTRPEIMTAIQKNAWTEGKFEFRFDVLINNKSGVGNVQQIYLSVDPTDLFYIGNTYTLGYKNGKAQVVITYTHNDPSESGRNFNELEYKCHLPIINWDLQTNSPIWRISLAEVDNTETITVKEGITNEFATNFGIGLDINVGVVKLGLNYGHSNKETFTREVTTSKTVGEDDLGSVLVNFSDPIITSVNPRSGANMMTHSNQYFELLVFPQKYY